MVRELKIFLGAIASAVVLSVSYGADVTVPSTWDEATQMWIGDVDALTNALRNAVNNQTIYLSKGVYDLSPLTNAPMYKADGSGYGAAPTSCQVTYLGGDALVTETVNAIKECFKQ